MRFFLYFYGPVASCLGLGEVKFVHVFSILTVANISAVSFLDIETNV